MKTLLFIVVSATMLLSGCKSKEEKANELIKDDMFKVLYDFASYEPLKPIQTVLLHLYIQIQSLQDMPISLKQLLKKQMNIQMK